jgi:hypothetical protein
VFTQSAPASLVHFVVGDVHAPSTVGAESFVGAPSLFVVASDVLASPAVSSVWRAPVAHAATTRTNAHATIPIARSFPTKIG